MPGFSMGLGAFQLFFALEENLHLARTKERPEWLRGAGAVEKVAEPLFRLSTLCRARGLWAIGTQTPLLRGEQYF